jgi:hypothetical protein
MSRLLSLLPTHPTSVPATSQQPYLSNCGAACACGKGWMPYSHLSHLTHLVLLQCLQEDSAHGLIRQGSGGLPRLMSPQERSAMHAMLRSSREELASRFTFCFYEWPMCSAS